MSSFGCFWVSGCVEKKSRDKTVRDGRADLRMKEPSHVSKCNFPEAFLVK